MRANESATDAESTDPKTGSAESGTEFDRNVDVANVLTIAGVDPSGGAGIQADLKTFAALGAYGMSVITAVTAQNTHGVRSIHAIPAPFVAEQLAAVFDDVRVDAVKIGMLGDAELIRTVAATLVERRPPYVVLDPVMVATSGDRLLPVDAVEALRDVLLPVVDLITPNLPEAADLLGREQARDEAEMAEHGVSLAGRGPAVLIKGGHLETPEAVDLLVTSADGAAAPLRLTAQRVATKNTHGTGDTLSAGIAALYPSSADLASAVRGAKEFLSGAIAAADTLTVGSGHGPVHHGWRTRPAGS